MICQRTCSLLVATVLLVAVCETWGQDPMISITTSTPTTLKSAATFTFNCTVTPYNSAWVTEIVKTMFEVTAPGGKKYTKMGDGWPMSIAKNTGLDATLNTQEGSRYTSMSSGVEADNMTLTQVMISSTKPEDSGVWTCRVWKDGAVIMNASTTVNLQVDGPIRSVRIYVDAMPGGEVFSNQTLSDGVSYTFMDGNTNRLTCEVGVPSSTAPTVKVIILDSAGNMETDITPLLPDSDERLTGAEPKAGGLVVYTTHIAKTTATFKPLIQYHGKSAVCMVMLEGYPSVNASFTFNVESKPRIKCPMKVAADVGTKNAKLECTVMANPVVTTATWGVPDEVAGMVDNHTVTNTVVDHTLTTSLTISEVLEDHYGKYNVTATNKHGTTSYITELKDSIVSAAVVPTYSVAIATGLSLLLALVLHR